MKKWISILLCLALVAGMVSVDAKISAKENMDQSEIKIRSVEAPAVETATVETPSQESPSPAPTATQKPEFTGNLMLNTEKVFTVTVNSQEKTCVITGFTGNVSVTTIYIPEKINGNTVTSVADKVFAACPYLKNVVVSGDVDFEGNDTFSSAEGVEIWGKANGKAAAYAVRTGRVFHPLEGPDKISGKKASSLNKATISWTAVGGAASYNVYRKSGKGEYSLYKNVTGVSFTNEKLKVGATYAYKVAPVFTAANGEAIEGYSSKSATVSLKPAKPKKVRAKGVRGGIQVRWSRNKNVTGYQVFMKVHVKGFKTKFNRVKTIKKNKITGYRCKMLVRGMKYSYKVRTYKTVKGKKIFSPFVTVTTRAK